MTDTKRTPSPGSPDPKMTPSTTLATHLETPLAPGSGLATLEPFESVIRNVEASAASSSCKSKRPSGQKILYLKSVALENSYEHLSAKFGNFGEVVEIRLRLNDEKKVWEAWITFSRHEEALRACNESGNESCSLVDKTPGRLDVYRPAEWKSKTQDNNGALERIPKPPEWLIATARGEKCNLIKMSRYLQRQVGGIKKTDITQFGSNSILIHAKYATQFIMLKNEN